MKQKTNLCPKADKCIHAGECIPGVFRSEYLCFDSGKYVDKKVTDGEDRRKIKKKARWTRK